MAVLGAFLDEMAVAGWQWGERDCLSWLGLWSKRLTGIDGAAEWRGRYKTAIGCARVCRKSGGLWACIQQGATVAGMVPVSEFKAGDVGLVRAVTTKGVQEVGGIFTGERWAVLTSAGVLTGRAEPLAAWGVR
jgi:hypothetical protein